MIIAKTKVAPAVIRWDKKQNNDDDDGDIKGKIKIKINNHNDSHRALPSFQGHTYTLVIAMATASQLYLLADHIKLSLLERQRAVSLNLAPNSQDNEISRSLEALRDGIDKLDNAESPILLKQYQELYQQFSGTAANIQPSLREANDPLLANDFISAQRTPQSRTGLNTRKTSKIVRFSDDPSEDDTINRTALMPYRDDPDDAPPNHSSLDNQQIHEYHHQVIRDQDEQLEHLSVSVRRQGELSIQIGNELDEQNGMLGETEEYVDRHQTQLDRAKKRLDGIVKKGKEGGAWTIIAILTIILLLLLIVLK